MSEDTGAADPGDPADEGRRTHGPRVLVVEHEADCPPALLGDWLAEAGATLHVWRPYQGEPLPDLAAYDALLVLGGSMGAGDDDRHRWLGPTRDLVRQAADQGLPTLGTCLGHQLAAVALGGRVGRSARAEGHVGLFAVGWQPDAAADPLLGPLGGAQRAVHWNYDLVTALPDGARVLARTPEGDVQAARLAPTVWGVQWHPEVDDRVLARWVDSDREEQERTGGPAADRTALLAEVATARSELTASWRPLARALVELAGVRS